jgi:hypothetical protein
MNSFGGREGLITPVVLFRAEAKDFLSREVCVAGFIGTTICVNIKALRARLK